MTISRYLFRDDVLIDTGTSMRLFDEVTKKDDRMLVTRHPLAGSEHNWSSYRMACFIDNTWNWLPMPKEETARLRALLLLQQ